MNVLGFDTATAGCAVCVRRSDGEFYEDLPKAGRLFEQPQQTRELLPAIDRALERADLSWSELSAIAVGLGPGAFTGLRIGVTTARAIAAALELPLIGVSSLAALATNAGPRTICVPVIDARRGEYYYGIFQGPSAGQLVLRSDSVVAPDELVDGVSRLAGAANAMLALGDGACKLRGVLIAAGVEVPADDDPRHVVSGSAICELALNSDGSQAAQVMPNYIRPPDAKTRAEQLQ